MPDEVAVLQELRKGFALRHSLTPPVSDFKSKGTPAEIYGLLSNFRSMGLVDDNLTNPTADTDGVKTRWHLNFLGTLYLAKRLDNSLGHEDAFKAITGREAIPLQSS